MRVPLPESPRIAYAAALTRALLFGIRNLCEANGARFVVLTTERWEASHLPEPPTMFELGGRGYTFSQASARRVIDAVLQGLPTIRVSGIRPDAVISKADSHWNKDANNDAMHWLGRALVRELRGGGLQQTAERAARTENSKVNLSATGDSASASLGR